MLRPKMKRYNPFTSLSYLTGTTVSNFLRPLYKLQDCIANKWQDSSSSDVI